MIHRHLLPDEIDQLIDDELGFGVAPLRAHVQECAECRRKVDDGRLVADALEDLPHFAPSYAFGRRIMTEVPVFVPWHVSARDTVIQFVPQSRSARITAAAVAGTAASALTVGILWVATQTDVLVVASDLARDQVHGVFYDAGRVLLTTVLGNQMFGVIQRTGTVGIAAAVAGLATLTGVSILGLGALAAASGRRRA